MRQGTALFGVFVGSARISGLFGTRLATVATRRAQAHAFEREISLSRQKTPARKGGLHLAMLPLDDAGGRHIGELVVMRDNTALQKTFQRSVTAATLLSLLAGASCK